MSIYLGILKVRAYALNDKIFLSPPHMGPAERDLVQECFDTNWIAPIGPMITRFEKGLEELSGIRNVAALSSGTSGLHLALRLSGIAPGDDVWCSTMTFIGGVSPILYMGARPVFLDVDPNTFLLDLDLLENALEEAAQNGHLPKVIITTDLYGFVIDASRIRALANRYSFVWISDAAESVGAYRQGKHAGKDADFAVFSFNGNKIITTSGGGALASEQTDVIDMARFLATQARDPAPHYQHTTFGYNYRISNVCAAIGVGQLQVLEQRVSRRREINAYYQELLSGVPGITFSSEAADLQANRWLTTIRISPSDAGFDREQARLALESENIESRPLWKPMHLQPLFRTSRYYNGQHAARAFDEGLCLPSGSAMHNHEVERVCSIIKRLSPSHA